MKFNESWLREWVNPAINTDTLCDQITMLGLEVDAVEPVAGAFSGVVIGEVVECAQHPDADKLRVTKVNVGDNVLDIVCGAPNCRAGLKVACATVGAVLPGDFKIKPTKLRGQPSNGMLCSFEELGIAVDANGIIELAADAPVGTNFRDYLLADDNAIEISLTPNRADCLSIAGIAREVGVVNRVAVQAPQIDAAPVTCNEAVSVELHAPEACPRYLARVVKNVNVQAPTPLWMQEKLRRCGIRSIDPVVDITNYILLELGQPMHAFDAAKIDGAIQVRMAKAEEKLVLLDGTTASLQPNTLVIADNQGALAMAGIFGGEASGVTAETRDVVLEAAFFAPLAIAGRARQYGLHTDASHRFERGVDYAQTRSAMERATNLLLAICGGEAGEIVEAVSEAHLPRPAQVTLTRAKLDALLGYAIESETVTDIFARLGFNPVFENDSWTITSPSWRFDIAIEEDLIEEVARIFGYNNIPNCAPVADLVMSEQREADLALSRVKTVLVDSDYQEAITYSFVNPKTQQLLHPNQEALILPNPISSEMSAMRLSLLSGLTDAVVYNQNRQQSRVRLFETGLRFIPDAQAESGVRQEFVIGGIACGSKQPEHWSGKAEAVDFFDVKGDVERVLSLCALRGDIRFVPEAFPALHPGQSAAIELNGETIGFIGTLHPRITQQLDIAGKPVVFELAWEAINQAPVATAQEISRFPANKRDLALVVANDVAADDILRAARAAGGEKVTDVTLFDVFTGGNLAEGTKSLALSLVLQDREKTLEEAEINAILQNVLTALATQFNASLRD